MVQLSVLFLLTFLKDFSLKPFTQGLSHAISHHLQALATLYTEGADDGSQYRDGKINHFLDSLSLHLLSLSFFLMLQCRVYNTLVTILCARCRR